MTIAIGSHGTIVARAPNATPTVYGDIAELGDIGMPDLDRNEFDASTQNKNIDAWVLGMLRRKALTLPLNFLPSDASHDHLTGLYNAIINNSFDGYKIYQTASGLVWIASGNVKTISSVAKVDGKWTANVTIRLSGVMSLNGVTIGS